MVRGAESRFYDRDNPYEPRHAPRYNPKWYHNKWLIIGGIIGILILIFYFSGGSPFGSDTPVNDTIDSNPANTERDQLVTYIIEQQKAGTTKEDIFTRLRLAGYTDSEIETAFTLSDPVINYIMTELNQGTPKPKIVESLIKEGHTPEQIQGYFRVIESTEKESLGESLQNNWWIIAIIGIIIFIIYRQKEISDSKKAPKVYTLEECREYAEEVLKEKKIDFNPTIEYRNRPEVRQYRFVFEEPIYPEFNSHKPMGHRFANRQYYFLAVGYDKELLDFRISEDDNLIREFLYGPPKSYEGRGATEYSRIRERSEMPLEDARKRELEGSPQFPTSPLSSSTYRPSYRSRNRYTNRRYSPGPITGYEDY
jgi:hypothetical protein